MARRDDVREDRADARREGAVVTRLRHVSAIMEVTRDEVDFMVEVRGTYERGSGRTGADWNCPAGYHEPECDEVVIESVKREDTGAEVDLTEAEMEEAYEMLSEAARS